MKRVNVEVDRIHATGEQDAAAVGGPAGQVVVCSGQHTRRTVLKVEDAQAHIVLAPDAIDDLLAVRRITWEPRMHRAIGEGFRPRAVPAHTHDPCLARVAFLKPFAETKRDPLTVR